MTQKDQKAKPQIHMGRGIQHARELRNWTQEGLADMMGPEWNQKRISTLEKRQTVDEPILQKIAEILGVDAAALRNYEPLSSLTVNNFNDNAVANGLMSSNSTNVVNQIKEIVAMFKKLSDDTVSTVKQQAVETSTIYQKQMEEMKSLYERLLEAERKRG